MIIPKFRHHTGRPARNFNIFNESPNYLVRTVETFF